MKKSLFLIFFATLLLPAQTPCVGGFAGSYPCNGIDLQSFMSFADMGGASSGNDSWGWTDINTGKEYALVGLNNGTAFIDISDPVNPIYLGKLPTHTSNSIWRDIKTYNNYAFIVSEASGHGMQVFDLSRLENVVSPPVTFTEDAHYSGFGNSHNIVINEATGFAYSVGTSTFSGGPHFVNIQDPLNPIAAGGYSVDAYSHDAQVVSYIGPDTDYSGREILIGSNENEISIVDVTDKSNPTPISTLSYSNFNYTHQGWFTENQKYFIVGDELDEQNVGFNTRTLVFDLSDLDNPQLHYQYLGPTSAIDHNGYVRGNRFYLSNYRAGIRILKINGLYDETPSMTEVNYFDTYPSSNSASFSGVWNIYPYLESGNLIISDYSSGFYLVKDPNYDNTDPMVVCQNITVNLNASGEASITAIELDGGSSDDFGIVSRLIDVSTFTCNNLGDNNVVLTVLDDYGNKSSCTAVVTVQATTSNFSAGSWDITPNSGSKALFSDDFDTSTDGNVTACSCEVETGNNVTVNAGGYIEVIGNIVVNGKLIVENEGSLVQVDDAATVINNGTITVEKITPSLTDQDFSILGSPMSGETREGVYTGAALVRHHITGNFVPNQDVEDDYPFAENFADDNGDNWQAHTGGLTVGEGYLVKPFANGETGGAFTTNYNQGTLNNGVINFTAIFGDNQNDSPNILSNPYASSVDALVFVSDNDIVDAIYYWEHLTVPNISYPGYKAQNYDMGDISMYNLSGGFAAANAGGGAQASNQFIPSGQGFGIKANAAGTITFDNSMRLTSNNNGYRDTETAIDRLYLSITNSTYVLKSGTLIAFTELATDGYDRNYDANRLATPVSLYSLNSDSELGIQGRSTFNEEHIIPLGFSTQVEENQEYTISISSIEGELISNATVYLKDNLLNTISNLSETDYSFFSNEGNQTNRFEIVFIDQNLGVSNITQNIFLYPNPAQTQITIVASENVINQVNLYDIRGRLVTVSSLINQGNYQLDISNLDAAFYFVEINTNTGTVVKRIIKE